MKGSIHFRKDRGIWFVQWYHLPNKKRFKIYKYKGELIYDKRIALKLLACMQADYENGTFQIDKYMTNRWTDVIPYLWEWLDTISQNLSPATVKDYNNSIKNHLIPLCLLFGKRHVKRVAKTFPCIQV